MDLGELVSFLAPAMLPVYEFISRHVGRRLGVATELTAGRCYGELVGADVAFVCGLAYIELCGPGRLPLAPVAAPVLAGPRGGGRPVYFSDVVVRRDSPFRAFADLRGASWCYNEPLSHSGYLRCWSTRRGTRPKSPRSPQSSC